jgi:hypothetical protein
LGKGEKAPYGRELRYIPPRKAIGSVGGSGSWRSGRSESWGSGGKSRSDGPSWRKNSEKGIVKVIEGRNDDDEEEVTSPIKEVQHLEKVLDGVRTELFPKKGGVERGEMHVDSTMQKTQTFLVDKKKEEEKVKSGGKFKRLKRDEKRQIGETLPGDIQKKRKSGGEDMDLDEQGR